MLNVWVFLLFFSCSILLVVIWLMWWYVIGKLFSVVVFVLFLSWIIIFVFLVNSILMVFFLFKVFKLSLVDNLVLVKYIFNRVVIKLLEVILCFVIMVFFLIKFCSVLKVLVSFWIFLMLGVWLLILLWIWVKELFFKVNWFCEILR